jgi:hypothetical protein
LLGVVGLVQQQVPLRKAVMDLILSLHQLVRLVVVEEAWLQHRL